MQEFTVREQGAHDLPSVAVTEFQRVSVAFTEAAAFVGEIMGDPLVGAAWGEPSALARMTVGEVAGHLYLVVRRVDKHLDAPPPRGAIADSSTAFPYPRVDQPDDLDIEVHQRVRADGHHVAEWGWQAVVAALDEKTAGLGRRLPAAPEHVAFGNRTIGFSGYLATHVVELLVHADDLAVSVGADAPDPPDAAAQVALEVLRGARATHGDLAVLRAFTRRERTPTGIPSIF